VSVAAEPLDATAARLTAAGLPVQVVGGALVVDRAHLVAVARRLKHDAETKLDTLSSLCAVDWPKGGGVFGAATAATGGHIEIVSHLYSTELRTPIVVLKTRTADRAADCKVPSLTPVWRSAEYQEREAFDLYGVIFEGHPDLRRILMWDEFEDFPMRRDYQPPEDYEWEPTPHGDVLERARAARSQKDEA
jgi:NADH-quinone oxidoreductase subunit C